MGSGAGYHFAGEGLDQRKNGNVVWIAPREELAIKKKFELEVETANCRTEPLRTGVFQCVTMMQLPKT